MAIPDPISTIKHISEVVKKYNDIELMDEITKLKLEIYELRDENRELKERLDVREKMRMNGPHGYFFQQEDVVPFCPKCWEGDGKPVHLPAPEDYAAGRGRICRVCKHFYIEAPAPPENIPRQFGGTWS